MRNVFPGGGGAGGREEGRTVVPGEEPRRRWDGVAVNRKTQRAGYYKRWSEEERAEGGEQREGESE